MENYKKSILLTTFLLMSLAGMAQLGIASYYSDEFHGRETSSGEKYDMAAFTAAHKELPFGTYIKVTRLDNAKSVVVKVNDRGPYIKGRIVDLSKAAAKDLDMTKDGQVRVKIEIVDRPTAEPTPSTSPSTPVVVAPPPVVVPPPPPIEEPKPSPPKTASKPAPKTTTQPKPKAEPKPKPSFSRVRSGDYSDFDLYKIELQRPEKRGYGVQIGSFENYNNAIRKIAELQDRSFENTLLSIEKGAMGETLYKIILGPFTERKSAVRYKDSAKKRYKIDGFVVDLSRLNYE